jgi:hypothetical protein
VFLKLELAKTGFAVKLSLSLSLLFCMIKLRAMCMLAGSHVLMYACYMVVKLELSDNSGTC